MENQTPPSGATAHGAAVERRRKARHRAVPLLPEVRYFAATGLEVRSASNTDEILITGSPIMYMVDYKVRDMLGEFTERMAEGVATDVLGRGADVRFLFNHDGLPLARSTAGTMTITDSARALDFEARLDARQQLANDLAIAIERKDITQMSCGFIVAEDKWDDDWEDRTILRFAELLDVSAVTYPASPTTSIQIAQRMAMAMPVESRARLRKVYTEAAKTGKMETRDMLEAIRPMLDIEGERATDAESTVDDAVTQLTPSEAREAPATADERREQSMSYGDRQSAVYQAIVGQYGSADSDGYYDMWICDIGDDWVVWKDYAANTLLRLSYVIDADGKVTLVGTPEPVAQKTVYQAVTRDAETSPQMKASTLSLAIEARKRRRPA